MFCCFSGKKHAKQQPRASPYHQSLSIRKSSRKINLKHCQALPKMETIAQGSRQQSQLSKTLIAGISPQNSHRNQKRKTFVNFDNMLRNSINQEAQFIDRDDPEQAQSQKRKKLNKFSDISQEPNDRPLPDLKKSADGISQETGQNCNVAQKQSGQSHSVPKSGLKHTHSLEELGSLTVINSGQNSLCSSPRSPNTPYSLTTAVRKYPQAQKTLKSYYDEDFIKEAEDDFDKEQGQEVENSHFESDITLSNFHFSLKQIKNKIEQQLDDQPLGQTQLEAENDFYCEQSNLNSQFSRAVVAYNEPELAQLLFQKMNKEQRNVIDKKGYTPIQLIILKALKQNKYLQLAKTMTYNEDVNLQCKNPSGWTPLQQALIYRNIPLSTHLFKAGYMKRQRKFKAGLADLSALLQKMPNFSLQIKVKVDSFLPLVGVLTPDDTLRIHKIGGTIKVNYSLVGYQFPFCKRRDMSILFDGNNMWALNHSKGIYCDLLETLSSQEMALLIEDMLVSEIRKGEPIVHEIKLSKCLSLFDNEISQTFGDFQAKKYQLELRYSSTAEKRRSNVNNQELISFVSDYQKYIEREEQIVIQQKNKNKKISLQLWLAPSFGLDLHMFSKVLDILGAGNNLLSKWSGFLQEKIGNTVTKDGLFPVKIDIPLNYSLYFNIQFHNFTYLAAQSAPLKVDNSLQRVQRKQFQGLINSKQKRRLFLEAYT